MNLEVKEMIKDMKMVQEKLGNAYHNAAKALNEYKKDTSNGKLTGLDLVIESQKQRIALLEETAELGMTNSYLSISETAFAISFPL